MDRRVESFRIQTEQLQDGYSAFFDVRRCVFFVSWLHQSRHCAQGRPNARGLEFRQRTQIEFSETDTLFNLIKWGVVVIFIPRKEFVAEEGQVG
jgi:hypothetical protein